MFTFIKPDGNGSRTPDSRASATEPEPLPPGWEEAETLELTDDGLVFPPCDNKSPPDSGRGEEKHL